MGDVRDLWHTGYGFAARFYARLGASYREAWKKDFADLSRNDVERMGARGMYQGNIWQYRWLAPFLTVFSAQLQGVDLRSWQGIIYLAFFSLVALEVFKVVLYSKAVSRELLSASLCGFVVLCLIGTFLFYQIDVEVPHSFSNTGGNGEVVMEISFL